VRSLHSNLFRTALTLLGIVIGVASVITMLAIGEGARKDVVDRISTMGSDLLLVRPGGPDQRGGRWSVTTLVPADFKAINEIEGVLSAIPELTGGQTLRYSNRDHSAEINATSFRFPVARQWPVIEGTFFSAQNEASYAAVAVLGKTTANALFPEESPLGKHLMVNNVLFQVIGVMDEKGASPMGQDQDDVVFVPYTTGSLRIFGQTHLRNITVAVADIDRMDEIEALIHDTLMARHGIEDFTIRNMASLIETISESRRVALLESYRASLLSAFQEVGDALDREALYLDQEQRLQSILTQAEETLRLTEVRYREGADDLLTLLESQRNVFDARQQLSQVRLNRLIAAVDLYKALGGGWQTEPQGRATAPAEVVRLRSETGPG